MPSIRRVNRAGEEDTAEAEPGGTDEESGEPGSAEEGPALGRTFVKPAERGVTGQEALDQLPVGEEGLVVQGREVQLSSIAVNPRDVIGKMATVQGTVALTGPVPAGGSTNVVLSNNNPTIVQIPSNVTVPAESTTAKFQVAEPVSL